MPRHDARPLAPRDVVARAIDYEMKPAFDCVIDISHKPAEFIKAHFPNIYERCCTTADHASRSGGAGRAYTCGGVV